MTFGRTAGRAKRPEWIYSQEVYFESRAAGEVIRKIHLLNSNFLLIANVNSVVYHTTLFVTISVLFKTVIWGGILSLLYYNDNFTFTNHLYTLGSIFAVNV